MCRPVTGSHSEEGGQEHVVSIVAAVVQHFHFVAAAATTSALLLPTGASSELKPELSRLGHPRDCWLVEATV